MHKSIATILESFKTFFSDEQIESSHSLMYQKYNIYDFRFSKKIAYFLEELTGLSASSMLQQHALAQFDNFVKSIEPIPTKIYPNSTISFFDKIINIEISMELMLTFTPTDGWYVGSYGSKKNFEDIYALSLDLITFHRTVKTFKDLKYIRCLDKYELFYERINDLNMNMYTNKQCLSDLSIDASNLLNYSDMNKIIAKIFTVDEQHIFKQIFSLVNFSSAIVGKELIGTQFGFCFETDILNRILANNKYFSHYIYSMTFHDFNLNCTHKNDPYMSISIIDEPEKFILHYCSNIEGYTILKFDNLNSLYEKMLELYRNGILADLNIELSEFTQKYFELYEMASI